MKKMVKTLMILIGVSSIFMIGSSVTAAEKPRMLKPCAQCHEVEANQLRGRLKSISNKAKTFQVFTGAGAWQLKFDEETELDGAKAYSKIGKDKEVLVTYREVNDKLIADVIQVKQPATIPPEWIVDVKAMTEIMKQTPEEGNYALYDARPGKLFPDAHLAGAISNYDAQFDKNLHKLPKDKNKLVIFYCGGMT